MRKVMGFWFVAVAVGMFLAGAAVNAWLAQGGPRLDDNAQAPIVAFVGVILAGFFGAGGATVAAWISARNAEDGREDVRRRMFADRTVDLAARYLEVIARYRAASDLRAHDAGIRPTPEPVLDRAADDYAAQLDLIVRFAATREAMDNLDFALTRLTMQIDYWHGTDASEERPDRQWTDTYIAVETDVKHAIDAFKSTIRVEVGLEDAYLPAEPRPVAIS